MHRAGPVKRPKLPLKEVIRNQTHLVSEVIYTPRFAHLLMLNAMPVAHEQQVGEASGEGPRLVKKRGKTNQEEAREPGIPARGKWRAAETLRPQPLPL